ncbi:MAG: hypothetical protein HS104_12115 [Polyangiaceae bacterium]|nr:hypothetical protein [Polyangiaceae bacterium]MCL4751739.1 hypothetical protein [Myxococcales bacterium]
MRRGPGRTLGALAALVFAYACQHAQPAKTPSPSAASPGAAVLELRTLDDRPAIGLVQRDGDPMAAVAVGVAHDFGSEASLALAELFEARLGRAGFRDVRAQAHGLGVVLSTLVATPADATRFVRAATAALGSPVQEGDRSRGRLRAPRVRGAADAAVQACSGELGVTESGAGNTPPEPADAQALEQWRSQLGGASSVAFAAVGPRAVLDALASAVASGDKWPSGPGPIDRWPEADSIGSASSSERRLSVAFRVADAARALEVAETLGTPGSVLATRLGALDGAFRLDRVVATTRVRGACLRVDVRAPSPSTGPLDVARAASVVDEETRLQLDSRKGHPSALDDAVLRPTHPADAAGAAAWRVLTTRAAGGPTRRAVSWLGAATSESELGRALAGLEAARNTRTLERRVRVESGQGELWALVASPCGTSSESSDDAGIHELLGRTLAQRRSGLLGVHIEPWVSPDSVGLLAHAPRAGASESAEDHARRVGDALGRALVATKLNGSDIAEAKNELLGELGGGQRGYFAALDAASGGHPSWLDPRGTWRAVSQSLTLTADTRRRLLLSGPLRLAVLANAKDQQAEAVSSVLERWLRPLRSAPTACAAGSRKPPQGGEVNVEVPSPDQARIYLTYPIAPSRSRDAEWTVYLANRPGGWLEQALGGLSESHARATALGGSSAAALLVELRCEESDCGAALGRIRGLWQRLGKGEASAADAEIARRHFEARDAERALEPRARVVELWRGSGPPKSDLESLRRFHQALSTAQEIVVHAKAKG